MIWLYFLLVSSWIFCQEKIAFVSDRSGIDEIYIMNIDGSEQINLSSNFHENWFPEFSPAGSQIVFVSQHHRIGEIQIMNTDGTGNYHLTEEDGGDYSPNFSPDFSPDFFS